MQSGEESLQILEYLFLHFQKPFQMKEMETEMKKKESLIERRARETFGRSIQELWKKSGSGLPAVT